jgi:hypothetical protein
MKITPENITTLSAGERFVFGSNEAGRHGGGAAYVAWKNFGAIYNQGFGPQGYCFAIPTKDWEIESLPLDKIRPYINSFIDYARVQNNLLFYVTKIGCGLAGYTPEDIAPMFKECLTMNNVALPKEFIDILNGKDI